MTLQEIFDKVWKHFVVDKNPPCVDSEGRCRYKNKDYSNGCAIGIFLPNKEKLITYTGTVFNLKNDHFKLFKSVFGDINIAILSELQSCHDSSSEVNSIRAIQANRSSIKDNLMDFAKNYRLQIPS